VKLHHVLVREDVVAVGPDPRTEVDPGAFALRRRIPVSTAFRLPPARKGFRKERRGGS